MRRFYEPAGNLVNETSFAESLISAGGLVSADFHLKRYRRRPTSSAMILVAPGPGRVVEFLTILAQLKRIKVTLPHSPLKQKGLRSECW